MNVDKMKEANRIVRTVLFFVSLALAMLFFTWGFTSYLYHCRQAKVTPPTVGRQIVTERFQAWRDTCQTNSRNFTHLWARGWTKDREQLVELRRLEIAAEHLQLIQLLKMARSENPTSSSST